MWVRSGPAKPFRVRLPVPPLNGQMAVDKSLSTIAATLQAGGLATRASGVKVTSFGRSPRPLVLMMTFGAPALPSSPSTSATMGTLAFFSTVSETTLPSICRPVTTRESFSFPPAAARSTRVPAR